MINRRAVVSTPGDGVTIFGVAKTPERERPWWLPTPVSLYPAWWIAIGAGLLVVDYSTGFHSRFPVVYVIPVTLAAWYSGRSPAVTLAVGIPIAHLLFSVNGAEPGSLLTQVLTAMFRGSVVVFMALWFSRLSEHERMLEREMRILRGLLPICSFCKNIRNEAGVWENMERYISKRSEALFSHGVCPSCAEAQYGHLFEKEAP